MSNEHNQTRQSNKRSRHRRKRLDAKVRDAKHWNNVTVMHHKGRKAMPKHCLLDPENFEYPVCARHDDKVQCRGLNHAYKRATMLKNKDVADRALEIFKLKPNCNQDTRRKKRHSKKKSRIHSKKKSIRKRSRMYNS
jgi:hypothetical protein